MKRVPATVAGALFFFMATALAGASDLALELYREGDWLACRRESQRVRLDQPGDELALALLAASRVRLAPGSAAGAEAELAALATNTAAPAGVRTLAAYEWGRACWRAGRRDEAAGALDRALDASGADSPLAPAIALALARVLESGHDRAGRRRAAELAESWGNTWTPAVRAHVQPGSPDAEGVGSLPGQGITWFYRRQVRPAIGDRCRLIPSCSEYFRQASRRHGLMAFPLAADRFVREPSEVSAARHLVRSGQEWYVADPLGDHDFWWTPSGSPDAGGGP